MHNGPYLPQGFGQWSATEAIAQDLPQPQAFAPDPAFSSGLQPWGGDPNRVDGLPAGTRGPVSTPGVTGTIPAADPGQFVNVIEIVGSAVSANAGGSTLIPIATGVRSMLFMRNAGTTNLYISFGGSANVNSPLKLAAGVQVLFDVKVPQNDVNVFSDAAGGLFSAFYATTEAPISQVELAMPPIPAF